MTNTKLRWLRFCEWLYRVRSGPKYFHTLSKYNPEWDMQVRVALDLGLLKPYQFGSYDSGVPKYVSPFKVLINDREVWIGNYPYSYGVPHDDSASCISREERPHARTLKRLQKEVDAMLAAIDVEDRYPNLWVVPEHVAERLHS